MADAAAGECLYLFSSNRSALYEQDILNVLAAPPGSVYTFRYDQKYVEPRTQERWSELAGLPVLVLFSIQQEAEYHRPAFIPVRRAVVVATETVGSRFFVDFQLDDYPSLPLPGEPEAEIGAQVGRITETVGAVAWETPYPASASLGAPTPFEGGGQSVLFERIAIYLSHTDSFRRTRFVRFLRLTEAGSEEESLQMVDGRFELTAGRTYTLELLHSQREELSHPEAFTVETDGSVLQVLGRAGFEVASQYNRLKIRLHAPQAQAAESRSTLVVVEPVRPVQGPQMEVPITIKPDRKRLATVAGLQTVALLALALPAALTGLSLELKLIIALCAALVASYLQLFNVQALKPISISAPKSPTPPASAPVQPRQNPSET